MTTIQCVCVPVCVFVGPCLFASFRDTAHNAQHSKLTIPYHSRAQSRPPAHKHTQFVPNASSAHLSCEYDEYGGFDKLSYVLSYSLKDNKQGNH